MDQQQPRIVVGVDDSPGSRAALDHALREAARRDASVEVVTALSPPEFWLPLAGPPTIALDDVRKEMRERTTVIVREVAEQLEGTLPQMPPVAISVVVGNAAEALIGAAEGAELLVVGSRGHGGFSSTLLGSVSLQCVLHARCSVTVVRAALKEKRDSKVNAGAGTAVW